MRTQAVTLAGIVLTNIVLAATIGFAADKTLSIVSTSGTNEITVTRGDSFDVVVEVNDATGDDADDIAGASFTIEYNTMDLGLTVDSEFFGTFLQQISSPASVTVDGKEYDTPLVVNNTSSSTMIAAAQVANGSGNGAVLFTLHFESSIYAPAGATSITITPSVINNTDAGYEADGEEIPLLVGIDEDSYTTHTVSTIYPLTVNIVTAFVDEDPDGADGIDDNWEMDYFGNLTTATATSNYDKDGYSDLQEYLNYAAGETDPLYNEYDPTVKNAPYGTEYTAPRIALPAVNLLLLND